MRHCSDLPDNFSLEEVGKKGISSPVWIDEDSLMQLRPASRQNAAAIVCAFFVAYIIILVCDIAEAENDYAWNLYRKGIEDFKAARYQNAVNAFREAYSARPSWKILYNIGQCEAAITRYGLALEAFEKYMVQIIFHKIVGAIIN